MIALLFASAIAWSADSGARELARADGAHVQRPRWSPDGEQIAWEANDHDKKQIGLFVGPFDGAPSGSHGTFRQIRPSARASSLTAGFASVSSARGVAHELSWSPPDLGRFVYAASNDAMDFDLYLSSGGALAPAPGADGGPAWSPDGRYIAFTSARTGEGDLYLLDLRAVERPPRRLTASPTASEVYPTWSPDSASLVFVSHSPSGDNLWLLPALDRSPSRLTRWPGNQVRPRFSPDGQRVAFYANREQRERFDLYVMPPDPSAEPTLLARGVVPDASGPSFTPDGRFVVATLDEDDAFDPLALVPTDGGAVKRLELGTVGHGDLDLVTRGDTVWIAYVAQGRTTDPDRDFKRLYVAPLPLP